MKKRLLSMILAAAMFATNTGTVLAAEDITFEEESDFSEDLEISEETEFLEDADISEEIQDSEEIELIDEPVESEDIADIDISEESEDAASDSSSLPADYIQGATGYVAPDELQPIYDLTEGDDASFLESADLPSSYITKDLPALRSQGGYGLCWAFATVGLAEINALKKGISTDLSELHLAYFNSYHVTDPLGGTEGDFFYAPESALDGNNFYSALITLSDWMGLAPEESVPYSYAEYVAAKGLQEELAYDDSIHVQGTFQHDIKFDSFRQSGELSLLSLMKKEIMDKGAVGITYASPSGYSATTTSDVYNPDTAAYYSPTDKIANHAVVVVGWDDSFSAKNFSTTPAGNGAWLVRNSWTTGDISNKTYAGYFWMSYYDATIENRIFSMEVEPADNYDNNYQYQLESGAFRTGTFANVFTCHAEGGEYGEELRAVAFEHNTRGASYEIKIYRHVTGAPDTGILVPEATTTGVTRLAGYETITLKTPVRLEKGEKFAVVVTGPVSYSWNHAYSDTHQATANPGESYIFQNSAWNDHASQGNFVIKAFTDNLPAGSEVLPTALNFTNLSDDKLTLSADQRFKLITQIVPAASTKKTIKYVSSNTSVAAVTSTGIIRGIAPGTCTITATIEGTSISRSIDVEVENKLVAMSISGYSILFYPKTEYSFTLSTTPAAYDRGNRVKWSVSDRAGADITEDGKADKLNPGYYIITAELDGVTASKAFAFRPESDFYSTEIGPDKKVTFKWKRLAGELSYMITDGDRVVGIIPGSGKDYYELTDTYYVGKDATSARYTVTTEFGPKNNHYQTGLVYNISFGTTYNITYHLDGGTQNPLNPATYVSGNYYELHAPTAPEGKKFGFWTTDAAHRNPISSIDKSRTGDLELYAYYSNIDNPTPEDDDPYKPSEDETEVIEDWGDITETAMTDGFFAGEPANVPAGIWFAFGNEKDGYGSRYYRHLDNTTTATDYVAGFTGSKVTLESDLKVFHGNRMLAQGRDYTVTYRNNVGAAEATAAKAPTVTVKGKGNYKASAAFSFTIKKDTGDVLDPDSAKARISMNKVKVSGLKTKTVYTGLPITLTELAASGSGITLSYTDKVSKETYALTESADGVTGDYVVICKNTGNAGKFSVTFKGINDFTGSISKTVTVSPFNIAKASEADLHIRPDDATYSKAGATPAVVVEMRVGDEYVTLREGIDYTLSYKNNKKIADMNAKKAPTVIIKGKGNLSGTNSSKKFSITKAPITSAQLTAKDVAFKGTGKNGYYLPAASLTQDGKKLSESFSKADVRYTYAADTMLADGSERHAQDEVLPTDTPVAGTLIKMSIPADKVALAANSSYYYDAASEPGAEIVGYYRIIDAAYSISRYKAQVTNTKRLTFNNGKEIRITENDIVVFKVIGSRTETLSTDNYRITSVRNNRFLGTATITIEGRGIYCGTKVLKVKLSAKSL